MQPWASLMAWDEKRIETRGWRPWFLGYVAIHASKGFSGSAKALCHQEGAFRVMLAKHGVMVRKLSLGRYAFEPALPLGAIVAVVELVNCQPTEYIMNNRRYFKRTGECVFGNYGPGRYGWITSDVVALPEPIPCRGALGLWRLPEDVEHEVWRQVALAKAGQLVAQE